MMNPKETMNTSDKQQASTWFGESFFLSFCLVMRIVSFFDVELVWNTSRSIGWWLWKDPTAAS